MTPRNQVRLHISNAEDLLKQARDKFDKPKTVTDVWSLLEEAQTELGLALEVVQERLAP